MTSGETWLRERIGERLLAAGLIRDEDLERALAYQARHRTERLGSILVRLGALSEEALLPELAAQTGLVVAEAEEVSPEAVKAALESLGWQPPRLRALGVLLWQNELGGWQAASRDPLVPDRQEAVSEALPDQSVRWAFMRLLYLEGVWERVEKRPAAHGDEAAYWRELAEDAPVIAFVNSLFAQAIDERASDIHLEPGERQARVRFRVDGVLLGRQNFPMERYPAVSSRLKLIARLDIAERRLPQDGRITARAAGHEIDLRVSVIPAVHGESIVVRLLPKERDDLSLDRLGLTEAQQVQLGRWLRRPSGLMLVTGPTGSGKSTTLYAALASISDGARKIVTVEDPVEYRMPGVVQIQVQGEIGYSFARALRAILRHDPDVILIGEIRDAETAQIALQAALTGHLVLATLHTNDSLSAVTRLIDMGIEPYLVAAALQAVMAQRLLRRLCGVCAREAEPPQVWLDRIPLNTRRLPVRWREPVGCPACHQTGYRGRLAIYEMVEIDAALAQATARGATLDELARLADTGNRVRLLQDGLAKVWAGLTSVAEVMRVAGEG